MEGMPWYSVMGNHDISQVNRKCACGRNPLGCSQIRKHGGVHRGHTWVMPDFNYYVRPLPGVNLEVVMLDTNHLDSQVCARLLRLPLRGPLRLPPFLTYGRSVNAIAVHAKMQGCCLAVDRLIYRLGHRLFHPTVTSDHYFRPLHTTVTPGRYTSENLHMERVRPELV